MIIGFDKYKFESYSYRIGNIEVRNGSNSHIYKNGSHFEVVKWYPN